MCKVVFALILLAFFTPCHEFAGMFQKRKDPRSLEMELKPVPRKSQEIAMPMKLTKLAGMM